MLNISVTAVTGNHLVAAVAHLAASTGSACHSGTTEPSPVLTVMGADAAQHLDLPMRACLRSSRILHTGRS